MTYKLPAPCRIPSYGYQTIVGYTERQMREAYAEGQQTAQPAQNEWKEAVLEQLAANSVDAPVSASPAVILEKIIHTACLMATDPSINAAQPAQIPAGYVLVPVEPTKEMVKAGGLICRRKEDCEADEELYRQVGQAVLCYMDMIAAAPVADTSQKEQTKTCQHCKHWGRYEQATPGTLASLDKDWEKNGVCEMLIQFVDSCGCGGGFHPKEDFGCNRFEAKV